MVSLEDYCGMEEQFVEKNKAFIGKVKEGGFLLPQNANENLIDYTTNKFKITRMPCASASEKSIMCFPENTIITQFAVKEKLSMHELRDIVKDSLVKSGIDAFIDDESSQSNDIVNADSKKIAGVIQFKSGGLQVNKFFISTADASHIVKHVEYPEEYKDRKNLSDASQRIGTVNIGLQKFRTFFKEVCNDKGIDLQLVECPEVKNSNQYIVEASK